MKKRESEKLVHENQKEAAKKSCKRLKTEKKEEEVLDAHSSEAEEEESDVEQAERVTPEQEAAADEVKAKKQKKEISLRQYLLFAEDKKDSSKTIAAFFLQTCPVKAREDFQKKWPSFEIYNVIQSAASDKTASWLKDHDSFQSQLI